MSKRDDVDILYAKTTEMQKWKFWLFVVDIGLSVVNVFTVGQIAEFTSMLIIIIALLYTSVSLIDDGKFFFDAESARRKNGIQDAYNVILDENITENYYNNRFKEPEFKYAVNIFESNFFSKEISEKMIVGSAIKSFIAVVTFIIAFRYVTDINIILITAQTVFSAFVVKETTVLYFYNSHISELYKDAYQELITIGISKPEHYAWLRYYCTEYECVKAFYKVHLDEKFYNEMNKELSKKWEGIEAKIQEPKDCMGRENLVSG